MKVAIEPSLTRRRRSWTNWPSLGPNAPRGPSTSVPRASRGSRVAASAQCRHDTLRLVGGGGGHELRNSLQQAGHDGGALGGCRARRRGGSPRPHDLDDRLGILAARRRASRSIPGRARTSCPRGQLATMASHVASSPCSARAWQFAVVEDADLDPRFALRRPQIPEAAAQAGLVGRQRQQGEEAPPGVGVGLRERRQLAHLVAMEQQREVGHRGVRPGHASAVDGQAIGQDGQLERPAGGGSVRGGRATAARADAAAGCSPG
ncbi:MAG: hypothetical protein MZU95_14665 [Desulfomicrobium escambiense]|nr:hypothetical protein [Desulfomicrobium escambiense]